MQNFHQATYSPNYVDRTTKVRCTCGWWAESDDIAALHDTFDGHWGKSQDVSSVVTLKPVGISEADKAAAVYFRELADRIEAGDIGNISVVFNDKGENVYERFGHWNDRWAMYGALEYAKSAIDRAD